MKSNDRDSNNNSNNTCNERLLMRRLLGPLGQTLHVYAPQFLRPRVAVSYIDHTVKNKAERQDIMRIHSSSLHACCQLEALCVPFVFCSDCTMQCLCGAQCGVTVTRPGLTTTRGNNFRNYHVALNKTA